MKRGGELRATFFGNRVIEVVIDANIHTGRHVGPEHPLSHAGNVSWNLIRKCGGNVEISRTVGPSPKITN
jgi:hypothetical protein